MRQNPSRNVIRYQAGQLIGNAWKKAATAGNAVTGSEATGIFPLNPDAIPDHFYSISESSCTSVTNGCSHVAPLNTNILDGRTYAPIGPNRPSQSTG
ncbi:hypothetical protein PR048_011529 [Dryococelus australis]|uniref:Uncharacterized protein n=1 Tax=Dryococelus australis TaxID=614101 RepID=A0ABQ9HLW7_9NEOP|nr:hypothetical protein PR048_011529 [Dryococelus australis]